jgi:hypothetical protein
MEDPFAPLVLGSTGCLSVTFRLLRFGPARFSEEHHRANEFFRIVIGFAVIVFMLAPCSSVRRTVLAGGP